MQDVAARNPASQLAVDVDVFAIDHITNSHFGRGFLSDFVDAAGCCNVLVFVTNAGSEVFTFSIEDDCVVLNREFPANFLNFSVGDQYVRIRQYALFFARPDSGVLN